MNQAVIRFLAALVAVPAVATGCRAEEVHPAPNILFCIADDWGWPHAGAYGDPTVETPNFDRVAGEGILFRHAYVSSPSCTPSRNAILTGRWHWQLGPGANLWSTLPQELVTYPHLLAEAGYATGHWRKSWGPGKLDGKWADHHPAGQRFNGGFKEFLDARPAGKPFCFWLGASDPHRPYDRGSGRKAGIDPAEIKLFPHYPDSDVIREDVADYYAEVQRFDRDVGQALALLEAAGEADNTIVVVTGDHGMPFPRCKGNLYDCGARVPLAMRWPARIDAGQVLDGFASLVDLAPTFLEAAGVPVPDEVSGRSLLPAATGGGEGALRPFVIAGKERHVPGQEAPDLGGTPMRSIRNHDFLLVHNHRPDRWPAGTPDWENAALPGFWLADCDNGPAKTYIVDNRERDDAHRRAYDLCFAKRPEFELFDLAEDPDQLANVAGSPEYAESLAQLQRQLEAALAGAHDPRTQGEGDDFFDRHPYLGGGPKHPEAGE